MKSGAHRATSWLLLDDCHREVNGCWILKYYHPLKLHGVVIDHHQIVLDQDDQNESRIFSLFYDITDLAEWEKPQQFCLTSVKVIDKQICTLGENVGLPIVFTLQNTVIAKAIVANKR